MVAVMLCSSHQRCSVLPSRLGWPFSVSFNRVLVCDLLVFDACVWWLLASAEVTVGYFRVNQRLADPCAAALPFAGAM